MSVKLTNQPKEFKDKFTDLLRQFNMLPPVVAATPVTPVAPIAPVAKFGEGKLKDGTPIKWDGETLAVGIPVMIIDPSNPEGFLPAPDGEMEMEDGTILVITEGKISEIKPVAPANPAPVVAPEMQVAMAKMEGELNEVKENFSKVTKENETFNSQLGAYKKEVETLRSQVSQMFALVGEMIEVPAAAPIEKVETTPSKYSKKEKLIQKIN